MSASGKYYLELQEQEYLDKEREQYENYINKVKIENDNTKSGIIRSKQDNAKYKENGREPLF